MPYERPSLVELSRLTAQALHVGNINYSFKALLGNAVAGLTHMLHGHIDYLSKQACPDQATGEYLERWAAVFKVPLKGPQPTIVAISITSTPDCIGKDAPITWLIGGHEFRAQPGTLLNGSDQVIEAIATAPGQLNLDDSAIPRPSQTTVGLSVISYAVVSPGRGKEDDEELRKRLLSAIAMPPQSGTALDYIAWAKSIGSVRNAWVRPAWLSGKPGVVEVAYIAKVGGQPKNVADAINGLYQVLAPAKSVIKIIPLKTKHIAIDFTVSPDTPEIRGKIVAKIAAIFAQAEPKGFLDENLRETTGTIALHKLWAISQEMNLASFQITNIHRDINVEKDEIAVYVK